MSVTQKRGRRAPPFFTGEAAYRFLPAFFFPPLAAFFAIALIPPFIVEFRGPGFLPLRTTAAWHVGVATRGARLLSAEKAPHARDGQL